MAYEVPHGLLLVNLLASSVTASQPCWASCPLGYIFSFPIVFTCAVPSAENTFPCMLHQWKGFSFMSVMDWMSAPTFKLDLTLQCDAIWRWGFWEGMRMRGICEGGAPVSTVRALEGITRQLALSPCSLPGENARRSQPSTPWKEILLRTPPSRHPDLALPALRTMRDKFLLFLSQGLVFDQLQQSKTWFHLKYHFANFLNESRPPVLIQSGIFFSEHSS